MTLGLRALQRVAQRAPFILRHAAVAIAVGGREALLRRPRARLTALAPAAATDTLSITRRIIGPDRRDNHGS